MFNQLFRKKRAAPAEPDVLVALGGKGGTKPGEPGQPGEVVYVRGSVLSTPYAGGGPGGGVSVVSMDPNSPGLARAGSLSIVEGLAQELIQNTALSRLQSDVSATKTALTQMTDNVHRMNLALGEMQEKVLEPVKKEMAFLRYNLGDKVNVTTTYMEKMVKMLDKQIWAVLRAKGMKDTQIRKFRDDHGMNPEEPSGPELEAQQRALEDMAESNVQLIEQNKRLLVQNEDLTKKLAERS